MTPQTDISTSLNLNRALSGASLIDRFVHPALRLEPDTLYRTRVLIGLLMVFASVFGAACIALPLTTLPVINQLFGALLCLPSFVATLALLLVLRSRGHYRLCSAAAACLIELAVIAGISLTGGILNSSVVQLMIVPPLITYYFGSARSGNYSLLLSLLILLCFAAAERLGVHFPQTVSSAHDRQTLQVMVCMVNITVVSTLAFVYELTASKLKQERDSERQKALALAQSDGLTGLANRRSLDAHLAERIAASKGMESARALVLCCIDLDDFKPINDQFGHGVGDEVLRAVASRLNQHFRDTDIVGRLGGDEFMVVFDAAASSDSSYISSIQALAERLLGMLCSPIETSAGEVRIGASLGFASLRRDANSAMSLKRAADQAMYEAKAAGGRCWRLAEPQPEAPPSTRHFASWHEAAMPAATAAVVKPAPSFTSRFETRDGHGAVRWIFEQVDFFVHPSLRLESSRLNRARILAMALVLVALICLADCAVMLLVPNSSISIRLVAGICLPIVAAAGLLLLTLKFKGAYALCSSATILVVYSAIIVGISVSGGAAESCATQLLVVPTLIAYFFGGIRRGASLVVISLITVAAFALMPFHGFEFDNSIRADQVGLINLIVATIGLLAVSGIACIYEFATRQLMHERDQEQRDVERMARTDTLTGLANRSSFDAELGTRITRYKAEVPISRFMLCYIDLDGFKPINDQFGHDVGDVVLQAISERLSNCLREGDYVGRHGGDEFLLLIDTVRDRAQSELVAGRLLKAIALPIPTRIGDVSVSGSLGLAWFPTHGDCAEDLKSAADTAMYAAKQQGCGWTLAVTPPRRAASSRGQAA